MRAGNTSNETVRFVRNHSTGARSCPTSQHAVRRARCCARAPRSLRRPPRERSRQTRAWACRRPGRARSRSHRSTRVDPRTTRARRAGRVPPRAPQVSGSSGWSRQGESAVAGRPSPVAAALPRSAPQRGAGPFSLAACTRKYPALRPRSSGISAQHAPHWHRATNHDHCPAGARGCSGAARHWTCSSTRFTSSMKTGSARRALPGRPGRPQRQSALREVDRNPRGTRFEAPDEYSAQPCTMSSRKSTRAVTKALRRNHQREHRGDAVQRQLGELTRSAHNASAAQCPNRNGARTRRRHDSVRPTANTASTGLGLGVSGKVGTGRNLCDAVPHRSRLAIPWLEKRCRASRTARRLAEPQAVQVPDAWFHQRDLLQRGGSR